MKPKIAIHWFRRDLRLHDNEGLTKALDSGLPVLPIYCLKSPEYDAEWLGMRRWAYIKRSFLFQSLNDLQASLREKKSDLLLFDSDILSALGRIEQEFEIAQVTCAGEYANEELEEENRVEAWLKKRQAKLIRCYPNSLFHPDDLPFEMGSCPDVFTAFRKAVQKKSSIRNPLPTPSELNWLEELNQLKESNLEQVIESCESSSSRFIGGESMGLERLEYYLWQTEKLGIYKKTRNQLLGDDYSSKFSPWLAWGCLSPRLIHKEVKRFEKELYKNQSTYWLIFELIWRDFFRFHSRDLGERLFYWSGYKNRKPHAGQDMELLQKWMDGETGYPFVDANMKELNATGFMSNRGRQNVASFLVHDLELDWRLGAIYFESQLVDYDIYSNYGNWQYVAGVGTDPRPDRYFNIFSQGSRYDGNAKYIKHWLPELKPLEAEWAHKPWELSKEMRDAFGISYPERIKPLKGKD